jgi:surface polysaccharide O-acyltransferase-like enzyme
MRAVAIVAVVLIHVWGPSTEVTPERGPLQAAFFTLFVSGSLWAVPCFFFLSGLLLTQRADFPTWGERLAWLRKRGARVLLPYVFWSALCLAAARQTDVLAILRSLAFGTASYQMYFVVALVQAYAVWWLVMPWLQRQTPRAQTAAVLIAVAVSVLAHAWRAAYLASVQVDQFDWMRATVLPWIGYFACGCLVALRLGAEGPQAALERLLSGRRTLLFVCALTPFATLALMVTYGVTYRGPHFDEPLNTLLKPVYAFPMILVMAAFGGWFDRRAREKTRRLATALARDSYGIYLSHVLVMQLLSGYVFTQLAGLNLPLEIAYRVFALLLTIGVSWGIARLLALVPGLKWVSGAG